MRAMSAKKLHAVLLTMGISIAVTVQFVILGSYQGIDPSKQNEILEEFNMGNPSENSRIIQEARSIHVEKKQAIQHDNLNDNTNYAGSIPVFYNLWVANASESARVMDIVNEQRSHFRPEHKPFFIQSMGDVKLNIPNATVLGHRPRGTELVTLHSLWEFCKNNIGVEKVVYLHSKGSSRKTKANEDLRKFITKGALSAECASVDPATCNVCSSRFSPVPHPHTSGNMWLARCDYVRRLFNPLEFEERMHEFTTNCTPKGRESCDGRLRFSAEHWINSHPTVKVR